MKTLDTNVLVRVLVGDDPVETPVAERTFVQLCEGVGAYLTVVVIAELSWVLGAGYGWDRETIRDRLQRLTRTHGVVTEESESVAVALGRYGKRGPELADLLIAESARRATAVPVVTFDRRLAREPDVELLVD